MTEKQKQPFKDILQMSFPEKIYKLHRKIPASESLCDTVTGVEPVRFLNRESSIGIFL